ncbi:MAG: M1 family aminopeptidase [Chitinispirillia bacterium]|jgi:hypothetical protein
MNQKKEIPFVLYFLFLALICGCIRNSTNPVDFTDNYSYKYNIAVHSLNTDTLHISLEINQDDIQDTIKILAPPIYADNPFLNQSKNNFHNFSISDNQKRILNYKTDSLPVGEYKCLTISYFHSPLFNPVTLEYDVTFSYYSDSTMEFMPIPAFNKNSAYLQGNYIFAIPFTGTKLVDIWRDKNNFQVEFDVPLNIQIFGIPVPVSNYSTPYELLFSNIILFSNTIVSKQILFEGNSSDQSFRCINYSFDKTFPHSILEKTKNDFKILLNDIIPEFGILKETPLTIIIGLNDKIGLEGMYAFWLLNPHENDEDGVINMTMAHELIHSWVGIRTGEYDMSWWKEGTTMYLGFLVARRNNLCTQSYFENNIMVNLENNSAVKTYSFSLDNEYIRKNIFRDKEIGNMVYRKGAQINMLLDRLIREKSNNSKDLVKFLAQFTKEYKSKALYRHDLVSQIEKYSTADAGDIFSLYVDGTGTIPDSVLQENLNALITFGALGD